MFPRKRNDTPAEPNPNSWNCQIQQSKPLNIVTLNKQVGLELYCGVPLVGRLTYAHPAHITVRSGT